MQAKTKTKNKRKKNKKQKTKQTKKEKKPKNQQFKEKSPEKLEIWRNIAQTAYRFLTYSQSDFVKMWNWSHFLVLVLHPDEIVRWYSAESISILLSMNDSTRRNFLNGICNITLENDLKKRYATIDNHLYIKLNKQ